MSSSLLAIYAGSRITAAKLNAVAPNLIVKGANQYVTSSTTLQDDNALVAALNANWTYRFDHYLVYDGASGSAGDMQFNWQIPSGVTTFDYTCDFTNPSGNWAGGTTFTASSANIACNTSGVGSLKSAKGTGIIVVGSTAGNLQLQWAQDTSSSTPTTVYAGSYLCLWGGVPA